MKRDNLEQFIQQNRKQFDAAAPNSAVWTKIAAELPAEEAKVIPFRKILSIAASVVVLLGMGVLIGLQLAPPANNSIADIAPEFQEVEQFYANKVKYQLAKLAKYQEANDPLIQKDLADLDQWLEQLQQELLTVPKSQKEDVINTIIKNYKTKLNILEHVLEHAAEHPEQETETEKNISI